MISSAPKSGLDAMARAVFWRYGMLGLGLTVVVGLALYVAFGFALYVYYSATVGLPQREAVSIHPIGGVLLYGFPILGAFAANYFILKWVLTSLYGKNFGGMTFLLANASNDKDLSNAN